MNRIANLLGQPAPEKEELDRLFAALVDEEATPEHWARLNDLLYNRPDLQRYYAKLVGNHTLLRTALCSPTAEPSSHEATVGRRLAESSHSAATEAENKPFGAREPIVVFPLSRRTTVRYACLGLAVAASMLLVFLGISSSRYHRESTLAERTDGRFDLRQDGLLVRDPTTLECLSTLNFTPPLHSLLLPGIKRDSQAEFTLCRGVAWMDYTHQSRERGYLLTLPPKTRMDVYVGADAGGHNALSVVELASSGEMTGSNLSFSNRAGNSAVPAWDQIGQISKYNPSDSSKHYLFSGSFQQASQLDEDFWHPSDYQVVLESDNMLVIGWDDSGYQGDRLTGPVDPSHDHDFNDVYAIIRFAPPIETDTDRSQRLSLIPDAFDEARFGKEMQAGYTLSIRPGEEALLFVSSHGDLTSAFQVLDETGRIVWRDSDAQGNLRRRTRLDQSFYLIGNNGPTERRLMLQALAPVDGSNARQDEQWRINEHKVLAEGPHRVAVGYGTGPGSPDEAPTWNDIRVEIRRFERNFSME